MKNEEESKTQAQIHASGSIKGFKNTTEVENFYRFVHDNNLRDEARVLMEVALKSITPAKKRGRKKSKTLQ